MIDGLLREVDDEGYDEELSDGWVDFIDRWYAPLRFPTHGLQMLAAYVAQMAPASRMTNCAAFQAADEMRRVQRIAYRTAQLADHRPTIDVSTHRRHWEEADAYQPLRELVERALIAYDWGEALVVTNVVIKPYFDRLVNLELAGALAAMNHDPVLRHIHFSLDEDARWHRDWSRRLIHLAITIGPRTPTLSQVGSTPGAPLRRRPWSTCRSHEHSACAPRGRTDPAASRGSGFRRDCIPRGRRSVH